jgi:hypothetical protein
LLVTGETPDPMRGAPKGQIPISRNETLRQKDCNSYKSWKDSALGKVERRNTEGDKSRASGGIISQVKRQEEGEPKLIVLPLFVFREEYGTTKGSRHPQDLRRGHCPC